MTSIDDLRRTAFAAVSTQLGDEFVEGVDIEPASDADGGAMLRLTVHLRPGALELDDDRFVRVLLSLRDGFDALGEARSATVIYDLPDPDDADPES